MWSRKFYHSFAQLSMEAIRGNCEVKGEYPTFREVEPVWCSSSQTRRPTNWATPGNVRPVEPQALYINCTEKAIRKCGDRLSAAFSFGLYNCAENETVVK